MIKEREQLEELLASMSEEIFENETRTPDVKLELQATDHTLRMLGLFYPGLLETNTLREMTSLSKEGVTKYLAATKNVQGHIWGVPVVRNNSVDHFASASVKEA